MDTLLTLEELADYLKVSTRTVKEWAQSGELPGGKLGSSWRFRKGDVEKWVAKQLTPHKHARNGQFNLSIKTIINPNQVYITRFNTKMELLNFFIDKAVDTPHISCREELADAVFKREELMSTGIGMGIAVPHVRLSSINRLHVHFTCNKTNISDYPSLDNSPIHIGIFILVGRDQHSEYIKCLSVLIEVLKNKLFYERILNASDAHVVYDLLIQNEVK